MPQVRHRAGVVVFAIGGAGNRRRIGMLTLAREVAVSTDPFKPGGKVDLENMATESEKLIAQGLAEAVAAESQGGLFDDDPVTAEEAARAYEELGGNPGPLTVLDKVKENRKRGRTPGSKNRANRDLQAYLLQFGPNPAVAMMKIIGESEEAMIARSRQLDPEKKRMSFAEARAIRIRCAEAMRKVFVGDQPVQVDHTIQGVRVVEQIGEMRAVKAREVEGRFKVLDLPDNEGDGDA
jgi:hypothetical protein